LLHLPVFPLEVGEIKAALEQELDLIHVHGFGKEIISAGTHGEQGVLLFALAGNHDDLGGLVCRNQVGQDGEAFLGAGWVGR